MSVESDGATESRTGVNIDRDTALEGIEAFALFLLGDLVSLGP